MHPTKGMKVAAQRSFLSTRRGKLTLALLASVAFLDFVDASIVNIALPSIRRDLHVSVQDLQWVPSGYLLTYGGFMLLGGRAADLLGRRRVLVAGIMVIGLSSMIGGLADSSGVLVAARLAQGLGAAFTLPAALSILTTTFKEGSDRNTALGVWGGYGRDGVGGRRAARRAAHRGSRLALGDVREPDRVPVRARRGVPADRRRAAKCPASQLRPAGSTPGDQRHAAVHLRAREGAQRRLGQRAYDRRARGCAGAARRRSWSTSCV